jgi:nucleoside-diphosphate-sugar epimerase/glyoxylase-like metal-dependent hydrolase (beta-lactamase superfamily II)
MVNASMIERVHGSAARRILVTGGSGFIGSHLARALADAGHRVTCTGRNPYATSRIFHENITFERADLRDATAISRLCANQQWVFHTAALSSVWASDDVMHDINVTGTQNVVDACRRQGVERLVHVSSTAIFFEYRDKQDIRDDDPPASQPSCGYAATKLAAEQIVREATAGGLDAVIVRARAVFGPGDNHLLPRLLERAAEGKLRQVGDGENQVDMTYIDNLVDALVLAAQRGKSGTVCTVTNGEPVVLWKTVGEVLKAVGLPHQLRRVPYPVARAYAGTLEGLHRLLARRGEPAFTRYSIGLLAKTQTFDLSVARRELGYRPQISMAEGLQRTVAALRARDDRHAKVAVDFRLFTTGYTTHSHHLAERGGPRTRIRFHATFAMLDHPQHGITLFDTGYAPRFFEATSRFPYSIYAKVTPAQIRPEQSAVEILARCGIAAERVRRIVLSHFHADHIGGLRDFPQAEFIVRARAWQDIRGKRGWSAVRRAFLPELLPYDFVDRLCLLEHFHDPGMGPLAKAHDLFGDGSVRLFDLPGHASGQIGALVQTGVAERKLLAADAGYTSESLRSATPPHPLSYLFIDSRRELLQTLRRLREFHRQYPEVELIPTHCPEVAQRYTLDTGK